jgi:hypothetical protein
MKRNLSNKFIWVFSGLTSLIFVTGTCWAGGVPEFDAIDVARGVRVTLDCGEGPAVTLSKDAAKAGKVKFKVKNRVLKIKLEKSFWDFDFSSKHNLEEVTVHVETGKPLTRIEAGTGANLSVSGCALDKKTVSVDGGTGSMAARPNYYLWIYLRVASLRHREHPLRAHPLICPPELPHVYAVPKLSVEIFRPARLLSDPRAPEWNWIWGWGPMREDLGVDSSMDLLVFLVG